MKRILFLMTFLLICVQVFAEDSIPTISSDSGQASFKNSELTVIVSLTSDYKKTLTEWDRADFLSVPTIETKTKYKVNDIIVPFIVFSFNKKISLPLLCDADLIMPDGKASATDHVSRIILTNKFYDKKLLYRGEQIFGFSITDKYKPGLYIVKLKIYNKENVICYFETSIEITENN